MKNKDFRLMSYEEKYNLVKGLIFYYTDDEKFGKLIFSPHKGIKEYLIYQVLFLFLRYVNGAPKKPLLFAFKDLNVSEDEWEVYFKKEGKYEVLSQRIVNELIELIDDIGDDTSDIDNEVVEKYYPANYYCLNFKSVNKKGNRKSDFPLIPLTANYI